jgi:hypothetical protein
MTCHVYNYVLTAEFLKLIKKMPVRLPKSNEYYTFNCGSIELYFPNCGL